MFVRRTGGIRAGCGWLALLAAMASGCSRETEPLPAESPPEAPTPPPASPATSTPPVGQGAGLACGELGCQRFADAAAALSHVLSEAKPQILAIGEAHALAGTEHVATATERFEKQLLPQLAERGATELVVELLNPAKGCQETVKQVRRTQEPVVEKQDQGNQNRFVQLGHTSRKLGVVPYILEPTCDEYAGVAKGGADGLMVMLELIADKTEDKLLSFWKERGKQASEQGAPLVLAYGGAMHNDIDVPPEKASFAFGKSVLHKTGGKYVALDLIVPEYIQPTAVWKALPWYPHFDASQSREQITLFRVDEHSYVLIFPHGVERPEASRPKAPEQASPASEPAKGQTDKATPGTGETAE